MIMVLELNNAQVLPVVDTEDFRIALSLEDLVFLGSQIFGTLMLHLKTFHLLDWMQIIVGILSRQTLGQFGVSLFLKLS